MVMARNNRCEHQQLFHALTPALFDQWGNGPDRKIAKSYRAKGISNSGGRLLLEVGRGGALKIS
ncbi:UNVERIFIED_CONTAM: hypothetical protein Sradi_1438400 [Sesamum radiatum]|uniref:Uncharacterized protein n=1 Tax=Sesamum radiatum TaxID=300843 RepID=A0AAW2U6P4_SESRA